MRLILHSTALSDLCTQPEEHTVSMDYWQLNTVVQPWALAVHYFGTVTEAIAQDKGNWCTTIDIPNSSASLSTWMIRISLLL